MEYLLSYIPLGGLIVIYFGLVHLYGKIAYRDGLSRGRMYGELDGADLMVKFLKARKVIAQDKIGNMYRITDDGCRGNTILSIEDLFKARKIIVDNVLQK